MRSLSATAELLVIINHPYVQCKQQLDFTAQEVPCGSVSCKSALRFAFACKERTEVLKYHSRMHQNSPFWDTNYKNFLGRGLTPLQTHRVPSILDHTIIWWNYNHVKIEDDTGLNANDAWRIAHNRKSSKALRPVAGQAFQWVSE